MCSLVNFPKHKVIVCMIYEFAADFFFLGGNSYLSGDKRQQAIGHCFYCSFFFENFREQQRFKGGQQWLRVGCPLPPPLKKVRF